MLQRRRRAQACCSAGCAPGLAGAPAPVVCGAGAGESAEIGGVGGDVPAVSPDAPGASLVSVGTASAAGSGQSDDDDTSRLVDGAVELL